MDQEQIPNQICIVPMLEDELASAIIPVFGRPALLPSHRSMKSLVAVLAGFGMILGGLGGCAPTVVDPAPLDPIKTTIIAPQPSESYKIGAGDELELKFTYAPDLNDRMIVRPDGKISVLFLQDVQAGGRTPSELAKYLKKALAPHVRQPDVVVIVRTVSSQRVYVGGEVARPGPVQLIAGNENVLQVLDEAGWLTPFAGRDQVELVRRWEDGSQTVYSIDVRKLMTGEDMSQNVDVQAGDIVLVPPSGAVEVDRWVDQNIRQALPFSSTVGAYYNFNPANH
jgi:polysaccharide export outer membrane protein